MSRIASRSSSCPRRLLVCLRREPTTTRTTARIDDAVQYCKNYNISQSCVLLLHSRSTDIVSIRGRSILCASCKGIQSELASTSWRRGRFGVACWSIPNHSCGSAAQQRAYQQLQKAITSGLSWVTILPWRLAEQDHLRGGRLADAAQPGASGFNNVVRLACNMVHATERKEWTRTRFTTPAGNACSHCMRNSRGRSLHSSNAVAESSVNVPHTETSKWPMKR